MSRWHTALALLGLHLVLTLGMQRKVPLPERLAAYPGQLLSVFRPDILREVGAAALLTAAYLGLGLGLAWLLVGALNRVHHPVLRLVLWALEGLPPFLLLILGVWGGLSSTLARGRDFPLMPWSPVMLTLFTVALALPAAARVALATRVVQAQALGADYTRTARAMGLPEATATRRALRVALPERAAGLAGDVPGLALALVVMEGLLQFPGLGNTLYVALQAALSGVETSTGQTAAAAQGQLQVLSASLLAWLLLGGLGSGLLRGLAQRLDPRPRQGQPPEGA